MINPIIMSAGGGCSACGACGICGFLGDILFLVVGVALVHIIP